MAGYRACPPNLAAATDDGWSGPTHWLHRCRRPRLPLIAVLASFTCCWAVGMLPLMFERFEGLESAKPMKKFCLEDKIRSQGLPHLKIKPRFSGRGMPSLWPRLFVHHNLPGRWGNVPAAFAKGVTCLPGRNSSRMAQHYCVLHSSHAESGVWMLDFLLPMCK